MKKVEQKLIVPDIPWIPVAIVVLAVGLMIYLACIPFRADFYFKEGKMYTDYRKVFEAKDDFEKAVRILPYDSGINTHYAIAMLNVARNVEEKLVWFDKGISRLKFAAAIDPLNADNFYILGKVYLSLDETGIKGSIPDSIAYSRKAIAIDPYYAEAYLDLGIAYEKVGKQDDARDMYKKALMMNPELEEPIERLLSLCQKRGRMFEGISILEEAARKYPSFVPPSRYLARAYLEAGRIDKAIDFYSEILKKDPKNVGILVGLGDAYTYKGQLNNAKDSYLSAVMLDPMNPDAHNGLGTVYMRSGDREKAYSEFNQSLMVNPENAYAKRMLKSMGY
ncbi:MAG: tetratricopeptide repeat protein [Candidatus Saganbacteria bacterium]|nr:tetratricopeptide repeat protein [Candidatus Saganbacteria bacterium]